MEELSAELSAGLLRLRKGYVDAAEAVIRILDPSAEYPYEFLVYRLTSFRPRGKDLPGEPMPGTSVRSDLLNLMLDLCDSFELRTGDYTEPVYDTPALARRFHVSTKTVQRWRRRGLPARRLVFPDGKRRVAFVESTVQWFVGKRRQQILRSMKFTQMTESEREETLRRARRMVSSANCSLNDVAKRLAVRTGRAVETIRYTIRKHDRDHPGDAIFPYLAAPLGEREKMVIYRCFLRGMSATALAKRYNRTRGSIYRIINEMRATQLLRRPITYMHNTEFDLPNAEEVVFGGVGDDDRAGLDHRTSGVPKAPPGLPPYLRALYDVPLLKREQECDLFRRYNYLKYRADQRRQQIDVNRIRTRLLKQVEALLLRANVVKNRIIRANLRLVVSIAKKHVAGPQSLFELISDGNVSLMQAVEKFDYGRGNRFSTYASWAIMRNFARSVPRERYLLDRFATGHEEVLDIAAALRSYDPNDLNVAELRESIDAVLAQLSPRERAILIDHYGLGSAGTIRTFDQLGRRMGISKERVRQIEIQALRKLRRILYPQKADLLS